MIINTKLNTLLFITIVHVLSLNIELFASHLLGNHLYQTLHKLSQILTASQQAWRYLCLTERLVNLPKVTTEGGRTV